MQKVFFLLLVSLFLCSCSDNEDDNLTNDDFKSVKVVITRESSDFTHFFLNTTFTIDNDSKNYQINKADFDMVVEDEINLLLIKKHEPVTSKYEVEVKLREVKIQVLENPMIDSEDEVEADLNTKMEIYVDGQLKKTHNFIFNKNSSNINILQYSEK